MSLLTLPQSTQMVRASRAGLFSGYVTPLSAFLPRSSHSWIVPFFSSSVASGSSSWSECGITASASTCGSPSSRRAQSMPTTSPPASNIHPATLSSAARSRGRPVSDSTTPSYGSIRTSRGSWYGPSSAARLPSGRIRYASPSPRPIAVSSAARSRSPRPANHFSAAPLCLSAKSPTSHGLATGQASPAGSLLGSTPYETQRFSIQAAVATAPSSGP